MNIFYLDKNPKTCAQFHCDKHVVKMVLEYCQLLSSAHRVLDGFRENNSKHYRLPDWREDILYQITHINHPSTKWARTNRENYLWLNELLLELNDEYKYRYQRTHKCETIGLIAALAKPPNNIPNGAFFEPTQAMPEIYKSNLSSIDGYRAFYLGDKASFLNWKNRPIPNWVLSAQ